MKMHRLALLTLLAACTADVPAPEGSRYEHVDAKGAASAAAKEGVVILDVRTPGEYAAGHLKNAVLIDYKSKDFRQRLAELDKSKTYLLHCRSGGRSTSAIPTFKELGFQHVIHLDGGMLAWEKAGLPVEK